MLENERDKSYIYDILKYSQEVIDILKDETHNSFVNNRIKRLAVERLIQIIGEAANHLSKDFMKDGDEMEIQFYNGSAINLTLPKNLWLEVTYTENAVKGHTSTSVMKDATLETGVVIKVPAFIKTGDIVSVDTETYAYRERQK